ERQHLVVADVHDDDVALRVEGDAVRLTEWRALDEDGGRAVRRDLPDLPGCRVRLVAANSGDGGVDGAVVRDLDIVEPADLLHPGFARRGAGLQVELPNHGHARLGRGRAAVAIGDVQHAAGDVAAVGFVQHERRLQVGPRVAWILDPDPSRGVDRSVVI